MEQGKEDKISTVEEIKETAHDCCKKKSVNPFADGEIPLDRTNDRESDLKSSNCKINSAMYTDSRRVNVKRMFSEKEMSSVSFPQIDPEIECVLRTNGHIVTSKKSRCNSTDLNIEKHIQSTATKQRLTDQIKPGDKLAAFEVVQSIKEFTDGSHKLKEPVQSMLDEFKIEQTVEKCLEELIDQLVDEFRVEVESLSTSRLFPQTNKQNKPKISASHSRSQLPTLSQGMDAQSSTENLSDSSSQEKVKINPGKKPGVGHASKNYLSKSQRMKNARKDLDILSSILDEVERMNDYYTDDLISKSEEGKCLNDYIEQVSDALVLFDDISVYTITIKNKEGDRKLNVLDYGENLFRDFVTLLKDMHTFLIDYNAFRLQFLDLSLAFSSIPLEESIGVNVKIDQSIEMSKNFYTCFFGDARFDLEFDMLHTKNETLIRSLNQFDMYITMLAESQNISNTD